MTDSSDYKQLLELFNRQELKLKELNKVNLGLNAALIKAHHMIKD